MMLRVVAAAVVVATGLLASPAATPSDSGPTTGTTIAAVRPSPEVLTRLTGARRGGQFTPDFYEGHMLQWAPCGGTVAIDASTMTRAQARTVITAATYTTRLLHGKWRVAVLDYEPRPRTGLIVLRAAGDLPEDVLGRAVMTHIDGQISEVDIRLSTANRNRLAQWRTVTIHELAHALGAGHSLDPNSTVFETVSVLWQRYNRAEVRGLRASTRC